MIEKYIVIKTITSTYKCHGYSRKAGRVYFNSRAVNMANVVSITEKDGSIAYENTDVKERAKARTSSHHHSTLKGAEKCKPTKSLKAQKPSKAVKSSSLPKVIEL